MQNYQPYAPVVLKLLQGALYSDDPHWGSLQNYLSPVREYFATIGLQVRNFESEGFAYLEQPDPDSEESAPPLPRLTKRHHLNFKVTVLCILLREQLRQFDASDRTGKLVLSMEKIRELLHPYLLESNNEEKFRKEIANLVNQATELGFLKTLSGDNENYQVLPIIKAKIDAEMLENLKKKLNNYVNS